MYRSTQTIGGRRRGLALAALVGTAALLVSCSGGAAAPAPGGDETYEPPASDLKAELTYAFWDATQQPAIEANIAEFNKQYPNISVNLDVTPWGDYWTKLQTQASSDTLPDLFWLNGPNIQLYASNGKVAPITPLVDSGDIDPADYPAALVDLYSLEGVQYGVPKDFDTIGLWYNKALFAQAGVDVPTDDWTWDDLDTAANAISSNLSGDGVYGVAAGMDGQTTYYNTVFQAGGEIVTADGKSGYAEPEAQKGIQFWTELMASGASPSMQQLTDTPADQWFLSGKLAMYYGGSWFRGAVGDSDIVADLDVAPLPQGAEKATVIHGVSNVVGANSKNMQAARALQAFLAGEQAQQQQGEVGSIIPAFNDTQQSFVDSLPDIDLQVFLDAVDYAQPLPVSRDAAAWNALEAELLPEAFSGARPVGEITEELADKMNEALAKE